MKKRNKLPSGIGFSFALLILVLIIRISLAGLKDDFIIQFGIHAYRMSMNLLLAILIAATALTAFFTIKYARKYVSGKRATVQMEEKKETQAVLSVSRELDSQKLYVILTSYASKSRNASEELLRCAMQLKTMDIYQDKLKNLLENNGATELTDTQDILDKVEQYLCKAIRKVINYIDVSDENSEKDSKMIVQKLTDCYKICQEQLDQVKEFLLIMAEFLNKQGDNDTTPETLEVYKECILKSIQEKP